MRLQALIVLFVVLVVVAFFVDLRAAIPLAVLAPYWLGPIAVRLTSRYARRPQYSPFRPGLDPAPEPARLHLASVENVLRGLGFDVLGHWRQTGFSANLTGYLTIFEHPERGIAAMAAAIVAERVPGGAKQVAYTELWTRFDATRSLTTNNSPQPRVFASVPGRTVERFPGLWDVATLVRVHQALAARVGPPESPRPFATRDPVTALQESMDREMAAQVSAGYVFVDGESYRPTWKGAVVMAFRLLWPAKALREARVRRRADELLRELRP